MSNISKKQILEILVCEELRRYEQNFDMASAYQFLLAQLYRLVYGERVGESGEHSFDKHSLDKTLIV